MHGTGLITSCGPRVTVLGPILFNLYVNDLELKTCEIIQYADNTVLLTSHCDLESCKKSLHHSIEVILDFFTSLAFKLNLDKSKFFVLSKKDQTKSLQSCERTIEETTQLEYLAQTKDNELDYQPK